MSTPESLSAVPPPALLAFQQFDMEDFVVRSFGDDRHAELASALDSLPAPSACGPWIAGGLIRRFVAGDKDFATASDYDFFFRDQKQFDDFEAHAKGAGWEEVRRNDFNTSFKTPGGKKVQAIRASFYTDAPSVIDSFDFTICMFAYDGERLFCGPFSLWDLSRKRMAIHKLTYAVASMRRLLKYARQGFTVCAGCMTDFLNRVAENADIINSETEYLD